MATPSAELRGAPRLPWEVWVSGGGGGDRGSPRAWGEEGAQPRLCLRSPPRSWWPGLKGAGRSSALPPPSPCPITAPALGVRGKFCPEHGVETAPARSGGAEHPPGTVWGEGTRFPPSWGTPFEWQDLGHKFGSSQGAALILVLVPLTSSHWLGWAGCWGWRGGLHPQAPHGCPGAPCAPSRSLGRVGIAGQGEPCLLVTSRALAWHSLVLAAPLPQREVEITPGPLGCDWISGVQGGALLERIPMRMREEEAPVWQGCSATTSVHAAWTECIQAAKLGRGHGGVQRCGSGGPCPRHFLPLLAAASGAGSPRALPSSRSP